jgi:hypothetical protein
MLILELPKVVIKSTNIFLNKIVLVFKFLGPRSSFPPSFWIVVSNKGAYRKKEKNGH